ncbi:ATP-dependent RNA helicase dbp2 [Neocucurbitaria cava]|uniref:ATP-dependent RNA helicase dbp2 n=1 Tax=Neocucurbitaria cava TaxID=798079 RepID=A0A9W9CQY3_9PLEO|nr:ATP-dependent RNA helicase dbp2 [Neocucurbitaria cava]
MTATTALTAQNTLGVQGIHHTPPDFVKKQIDAVCEDVGVDVVKTGSSLPLDVMVSTSGSQLLPSAAIVTLINTLFPLTTILTPNLPEAKLLLQTAGVAVKDPENVDDVVAMAKHIHERGPRWVLLKGGHLPLTKGRLVSKDESEKDIVLNVLVGESGVTLFESKYLSTAIACNLASGMSVVKAVKNANLYIEAGIKTSTDLGRGSGPINHFHSTYTLPFTPGGFIPYLLDREDIQKPWKQYTRHEFVQRMADGSLPIDNFKYYMIQDYLFLIQFARANALAAYKSSSLPDIGRSVQQVVTLQEEIKLHIEFCKEYGLEVADIEGQEEDQATTAYTRFVLDIGQSQDWLALQIAMLPCLIGYGIIAKRLFEDPNTLREGSKYWKWVENYVAQEYMEAMMRGSGK